MAAAALEVAAAAATAALAASLPDLRVVEQGISSSSSFSLLSFFPVFPIESVTCSHWAGQGKDPGLLLLRVSSFSLRVSPVVACVAAEETSLFMRHLWTFFSNPAFGA